MPARARSTPSGELRARGLRLHIRLFWHRPRLLYPPPRLLLYYGDRPPAGHCSVSIAVTAGCSCPVCEAAAVCRTREDRRRRDGDDGREERQAEEGRDERAALAVVERERLRRRGESWSRRTWVSFGDSGSRRRLGSERRVRQGYWVSRNYQNMAGK